MDFRKYGIFMIIVCAQNLCAQLSGTYTVGGASPNFPNLDSAFNYMEINGVSGKVRLNVRSGNYTLSTTISNISGADSNKFIQISPDPTNSSPVIFKSKNDSANNFLIKIEQSFLKFDSLTFVVDSSSTYGTIISFNTNCNSTSFNACNFLGKDTNSTSTNFAIIYHDSSLKIDNLKIANCKFLNGSFGIYLDGKKNFICDRKNKITQCSFQKYYYMALSLTNQDSLSLEGNYSKDINKYTDAYGYYLNACRYSTLFSNKIYVSGQNGYGINFNDCYASTKVYNNIICGYDTSKSGNFTGVYITQLSNFFIFYNSIATFNKSKNAVALKFNSNNYTFRSTLKNNIYYAENGYALYHDTTSYGYWFTYDMKSDYNFIYTKGKYFVNRSTSGQYASLGSYTAGTKLDSHSINKKIVFENPENLNSLSFDLYKKGIPIKDIKNDIIGRIRKTDQPDIGPYELKLPTIDLALTSIENNSCSGIGEVRIKIKNNGFSTIDSSKIMWQISENGSAFVNQINFTFKGKLQTENDTLIKIGSYNFKAGSVTKVKIWVSTSNNKQDSFASNDTLVTKPILIAMSGDFTIGGSSPNFTTIDSALRIAKYSGICGPIRFLLRSGNYNERLIFDSIRGVSAVNSISFISDPKNTKTPRVSYKATGPNDNNVILLKNISYVTISGISFYSLDTNYSRIVEIKENVRFLNLINDSFISKSFYVTLYDSFGYKPFTHKTFAKKSAIYCNSTGNSNLSVKKCVLKNNIIGIGFAYCPKSQIIQNTISNTAIAGIYFDYSDSILLESNKIESTKNLQTSVSPYGLLGIYVRNYNFKIQKNKIILNSYSDRQYGIIIEDTKNCIVANNSVTIVNKSNSSWSNCIQILTIIDTTFVYNNSLYTIGAIQL